MLKAFSSISPVLKGLAQSFGWEKAIASAMLEGQWSEVVGEPIASHTAPEEIRFDTLTIRVDSAVWMHELSFLKGPLLEKINRILGKNGVRKIQLKIGPLPPKAALPEDKPLLPAEIAGIKEDEAALLEAILSAVSDDGLKRTVEKAVRKHLQSRRGADDRG